MFRNGINHGHLQERSEYAAPKEHIGLEYSSLTPTVIDGDIENALPRNSQNHKHNGLVTHIHQSTL